MSSVCSKSQADNAVALFWRSPGIRSSACWCLRAGDFTCGCFVFCLWHAGYIFQSEVNRGRSKSLTIFLLPHPLCKILLYFGPTPIVSPEALWFYQISHNISAKASIFPSLLPTHLSVHLNFTRYVFSFGPPTSSAVNLSLWCFAPHLSLAFFKIISSLGAIFLLQRFSSSPPCEMPPALNMKLPFSSQGNSRVCEFYLLKWTCQVVLWLY